MIKKFNQFLNEDTWKDPKDLNPNIDNAYLLWESHMKIIQDKKIKLIEKIKNLTINDILLIEEDNITKSDLYIFSVGIKGNHNIFDEYIEDYKNTIKTFCSKNNIYDEALININFQKINNLFFDEHYFKQITMHNIPNNINSLTYFETSINNVKLNIKIVIENLYPAPGKLLDGSYKNRFHFPYDIDYIPKFLQGTNLAYKIILKAIKKFKHIALAVDPLNYNINKITKSLSVNSAIYTCIFDEVYVFFDKESFIEKDFMGNSKMYTILNYYKNNTKNHVIDPELI